MRRKFTTKAQTKMLADSGTLNRTEDPLSIDGMPWGDGAIRLYQAIFLGVVILYCYVYAPYGLNQTDGGFISGIAWQLLQGKTLYQDVIYVRPPLPIWLQAMEIGMLPDFLQGIFERYAFFAKVAIYSWLAATLCTIGANRYILATLGFIVSVNCYPPAAWHTVDGLFFGVAALWFLNRPFRWTAFVGGVFIVATALCKQSFYPIWGVFALFLLFFPKNKSQKAFAILGATLTGATWYGYLWTHGLWENYHAMTSAAASISDAIQHGIVDYFNIHPVIFGMTIVLWIPILFYFKNENKLNNRVHFIARTAWALWLFGLMASYFCTIIEHQKFTIPYAQIRVLFWTAAIYYKVNIFKTWKDKDYSYWMPFLLLCLAWMASVSWGYNLPILLAVPVIFAQMEIGRRLFELAGPYFQNVYRTAGTLMTIFLLMTTYRFAYEFTYRDAPRTALTQNMGSNFKRLTGIRSSLQNEARYTELKAFIYKYDSNFAVLPDFTNAHFVSKTKPVLPMGWVVKREMGGFSKYVEEVFLREEPYIFLQKAQKEKVEKDEQMETVRKLLSYCDLVDSGTFFDVYQVKE